MDESNVTESTRKYYNEVLFSFIKVMRNLKAKLKGGTIIYVQ